MAPTEPPRSDPNAIWKRLRGKPAKDVVIAQVENSDHVAVGKNIIQIGKLQIPRWAAIAVAAAVVLVAVFAGATAFFTRQTGASTEDIAAILAATVTPTATLTPTPTITPTPLPFAPAEEGETLILVLPFDGVAAADSEPHRRIWRRIDSELAALPSTKLTVKLDPNAMLGYDQRAEAEALGKMYNATIVIWGEATDVAVTVSFLNLRQPDFEASDVSIDETHRARLANPDAYAQFVTNDLPAQLSFLALFAIGQSLWARADEDAAAVTITRAISSTIALLDIPEGLADAYFRLGYLNESSQGNLDAAIANYSDALALEPKDAPVYNNRGLAFQDIDDIDAAIADFTQAISLEPTGAYLYVNRGAAYALSGDLDAAIADFTQALTLDRKSAPTFINRGTAYALSGDIDAAIADYEQAIVLDPNNAEPHFLRSRVYGRLGDFASAIAGYSKTLDLDPTFFPAYSWRGLAHGAQGNVAAAVADFGEALALNPTDAFSYNCACWVLATNGEPQRALPYCEQAVALSPEPQALDSRGLAYALLGNYPAAIADFQVFVDSIAALGAPNPQKYAEQRQSWIEALKQGKNPFTPEVLEQLRNE